MARSNLSSQFQAQIVMILLTYLSGAIALQSLFSVASSEDWSGNSRCKTYPGDPRWPSQQEWQQLGQQVSALIQPKALASACRSDSFDQLACFTLTNQWSNSSWVAENAYMSDYNDDTCPLDPSLPCSADGYPAYVVDARNAQDVQLAVKFAKKYDLRLVVKGTGHDFPGRSAGSQALSIWTHNLRGIEIDSGNAKAKKYGGTAAITISAGHRWREVYERAAASNLTVVGGGDNDVGVGGWYLNGGHSPISSAHGLGADQILSLEVVTADGQLLTVDESTFPDLFFALRGGSPTFGVVTKFIVKAYPKVAATVNQFFFAAPTDSEAYSSVLTRFHSHIIDVNQAGGMGYYYVLPGVVFDPTLINQSILTGLWIFLNRTEAEANLILEPLYSDINKTTSTGTPIVSRINSTTVLNFLEFWQYNPSEGVGSSGRLTSWLLDEKALSDPALLRQQLETATSPDGIMIGHIVAGPGVSHADIPGGSNAVLPAWRKAYVHAVIPASWTKGNASQKALVTRDVRERVTPALRKLSSESGAYINEADPSNPYWQHDYYGANYGRLLEIKHKYDPTGLFWCKPCVGWDEFDIADGPQDVEVWELGIGECSWPRSRKMYANLHRSKQRETVQERMKMQVRAASNASMSSSAQ